MNGTVEHQYHPPADVGSQRVARVYAEALVRAGDKRGQVREIIEEYVSLIENVFGSQPQFEALLASAAVGRKHKIEIITKVFKGRANELFFNFLLVLNDHDRLDLIRLIGLAGRDILDKRARRMRVQVRAAAPLQEEQRARLEHELAEAFKLQPILDIQVDPELLGGMIVRVGDWLYDASVRTQINKLQDQLIARSSHEIQSRRDSFSSDS